MYFLKTSQQLEKVTKNLGDGREMLSWSYKHGRMCKKKTELTKYICLINVYVFEVCKKFQSVMFYQFLNLKSFFKLWEEELW